MQPGSGETSNVFYFRSLKKLLEAFAGALIETAVASVEYEKGAVVHEVEGSRTDCST